MCFIFSGLTDQGLYRVVGVNSKVNKLTNMGLGKLKVNTSGYLKDYFIILLRIRMRMSLTVQMCQQNISKCLQHHLCQQYIDIWKPILSGREVKAMD